MSWETRWSEFAAKVRDGNDPRTLNEIACFVAESWPELEGFLKDLELPTTEPTQVFRAFVDAVEADLVLESGENANDEPYATFGEFLESVARQMGVILGRSHDLAAPSPFDQATGLRTPYTVAALLAACSFWLRSVAQWFGEPVGRAGEGRRQFDPNDFGGGVYPWSSP